MKNPNIWLLVLFLLHALAPRNSSANPIAQAEISSITESEGNSKTTTVHTVTFKVKQNIQSVLSGNYSYITDSDASKIKEAVLQSVVSGKVLLSPAEYDEIVQYDQRIEAIELGNFSRLTQNDAEVAMNIVMQTVLSGNFSNTSENDLMEIMQDVLSCNFSNRTENNVSFEFQQNLSCNFSNRTENNVTFEFQQKIQAIMTGNFSSLTENDEVEVLEAVLKSVWSANISSSTENNALFSAQQKIQSILLGNYSSLIENNVTDVIEAVVEEMLLLDSTKLTEEDKEEFMIQTNVSSLSPTVNGFLDGTNMMISMIANLKGKVKDSKFDKIVIDMEEHLFSLPAALTKNRKIIITLLYKARDKIVYTKNLLMIAATKLRSHCQVLIALFEKHEPQFILIKYITGKFVRYATFVKEVLEDAEVELKATQDLLSTINGEILQLISVLDERETKLLEDLHEGRRAIEKERAQVERDCKNIQERIEKRNFNIKLSRLIIHILSTYGSVIGGIVGFGVGAIPAIVIGSVGAAVPLVTESSIAIANAVENNRERKRREKLDDSERDMKERMDRLDNLSERAMHISNVNVAAEGARGTVDEMKEYVRKEVLLIENWQYTIKETLAESTEEWSDEDFILIEGTEKIIQSLEALIKVCDNYIDNKLPDYLRSK